MEDPKSQAEELLFNSKGARKVWLWICVLKMVFNGMNLEGPEQERWEAGNKRESKRLHQEKGRMDRKGSVGNRSNGTEERLTA